MKYGKVDKAFVKALREIVGERNVIFEDKEKLENYSSDESGAAYYSFLPDVAVKPESAEQISKIVKLANDAHIPITPRGAGSGLAGGAVPIYGGTVQESRRERTVLRRLSDERGNEFHRRERRNKCGRKQSCKIRKHGAPHPRNRSGYA